MHDNEYTYEDDRDLHEYEAYMENREVKTKKCHCGRTVHLDSSWANTCDCGAEYNGAGQRLADRRCWGEETGEHWADLAGLSDGELRNTPDDYDY